MRNPTQGSGCGVSSECARRRPSPPSLHHLPAAIHVHSLQLQMQGPNYAMVSEAAPSRRPLATVTVGTRPCPGAAGPRLRPRARRAHPAGSSGLASVYISFLSTLIPPVSWFPLSALALCLPGVAPAPAPAPAVCLSIVQHCVARHSSCVLPSIIITYTFFPYLHPLLIPRPSSHVVHLRAVWCTYEATLGARVWPNAFGLGNLA